MKITIIGCAATLLFLLTGCQTDYFPPERSSNVFLDLRDNLKPLKTTGSIEVLLPGGSAGMSTNTTGSFGRFGKRPAAKPVTSTKRVFASFEAFEATEQAAAKGSFTYTVMKNGILERQIKADIFGVYIDPVEYRAWFLGLVVQDTKPCVEPGEHDENCDGDHPEGTSCDGEDDVGHDESCSGEDHEGGPGGSTQISGKNCRMGQIIAVRLQDGGTPGTNGDDIAWKWFSALDASVPNIQSPDTWPHLCTKEILSGNLAVHVK